MIDKLAPFSPIIVLAFTIAVCELAIAITPA